MNKKELEQAFQKVKVQALMRGSVFITTIGFNMKTQWSDKIPTAGTDGSSLLFNPDFFMSLDKNERLFLYLHEVWHVAFLHMIRRGTRDPEKWNIAADYVINYMLTQKGYKMPADGLLDSKYANMSTDQVYDLLPDPPPSQTVDMDIMYPDTSDMSNAEKQAAQATLEGLVLRAATASRQVGEKVGTIPDSILTAIDELINPILPWNVILQQYMSSYDQGDYIYRKPNRRLLSIAYLPTLYSEAIDLLVVYIDVSCSVSKEEFIAFLSEIQEIHQTLKPNKLVIHLFNTHIIVTHEIGEYDDVMDIQFTKGGGTDLDEVHANIQKECPTVALVFSDLEVDIPDEEPVSDVIWICINNKSRDVPWGKLIHYTT